VTESSTIAHRAYARLTRSFIVGLLAVSGAVSATSAHAFNFYDVARKAKELSNEKFKAPTSALPRELRDLKFADYQQIQLKREKYHWADNKSPFELVFHHQGMYFDLPIKINEVDAEGVREIKYDPNNFDFGPRKPDAKALNNLGFAGFKVLYPLNNSKKPDDEIASFLGASYFRVVGKGQQYGISARGLAIDTAVPSGEEFPRFREFWVSRPANADKHIVIYALLDSPRATGAFRFTINPGEDTTVDVKSRVYLRAPVAKLGIAPMASMFLYGSNQPTTASNFRPELHDSDGLAFHAGNGEWLWRPLNNPRRLSTSSFGMENPKGFGLQQRGREFSRYEDIDDRYETRPSLWVEPSGNWGKGRVELIEIPTADETNDNIVAFWVPENQPKPGAALDLDYTLRFTRNETKLQDPKLARVVQTLRSAGELKGADLIRRADGSLALMIDFTAPATARKNDPPVPVSLSFSNNGNADVMENSLRRNPVTGGWRVTLRLKVKDPTKPVEMRAALVNGQTQVSETWSYQLPANETAE
jgi:glucans biosynthesis protein